MPGIVSGLDRASPSMIGPRMGLLLNTIAGLVVWIVLWSIGVKAFDAFMITTAMILIAATVRVFAPFLSGSRGEDHPGSGWSPR
jgi:hypothetical protein